MPNDKYNNSITLFLINVGVSVQLGNGKHFIISVQIIGAKLFLFY